MTRKTLIEAMRREAITCHQHGADESLAPQGRIDLHSIGDGLEWYADRLAALDGADGAPAATERRLAGVAG